MNKNDIENIIRGFIKKSPDNSLKLDTGEPAWEEVLIGYSAGDVPTLVGIDHSFGNMVECSSGRSMCSIFQNGS